MKYYNIVFCRHEGNPKPYIFRLPLDREVKEGDRLAAIPVPDHGDLIDRQVVKNDWFVTDGGTIAVAVIDIDGCQTVIPADEEEAT